MLSGVCDAARIRETSGRTDRKSWRRSRSRSAPASARSMVTARVPLEALEQLASFMKSDILVPAASAQRRASQRSRPARRTNENPAPCARSTRGRATPTQAGGTGPRGSSQGQVYAHSEARGLYEKALGLGHPDGAGIHLAMGEITMIVGDYEAALTKLNAEAAARAQGPTLAAAENRIGEVRAALREIRARRRAFRPFRRRRAQRIRPICRLGAAPIPARRREWGQRSCFQSDGAVRC